MPGVFFQPFSLAPSHSAHEPGQHFACHGRGLPSRLREVRKACTGHTATRGGGGVVGGCRAPAPGHPAECGVRLTFQPLLGFYLDLEIAGGGGTLGKKRKVRNVIREGKKGKKSLGQTQGTEAGSTDSVGQGARRSGHPEAQEGDWGPRGGPASPLSLPRWTGAQFQRSWV